MNIPEWIQAIASLITAVAAVGAWLFSREARNNSVKIKTEIESISVHISDIETNIAYNNSPIFNMDGNTCSQGGQGGIGGGTGGGGGGGLGARGGDGGSIYNG